MRFQLPRRSETQHYRKLKENYYPDFTIQKVDWVELSYKAHIK